MFILKLEASRRNHKRLETITINHLKIIIAQFYIDAIDKKYTEGIKERFAKLLKYYGMESIADEYRIKFIANDDDNFIETLPFFESYHLTRLDIWIIATYYKLPIIILYYPSKALIETNNAYSILTTYFEEGVGGSTIQEEESIRRQESSDEDLSFMGEEAQPFPHKKSSNVQGFYFVVSPAIKVNTAPAYSIISKKRQGERSEESGLTSMSMVEDNEYYIPLNILSMGFQSVVIQQQSEQYINLDEPIQSEDDESSQIKESTRYKNSIIQFIQNFKPPSKKGKSDDSSSVGTGVSLDIEDENSVEEFSSTKMKNPRNPRKPRKKINVLPTLLPTSAPDVSASLPSIQADPTSNLAPKPLLALKAPRKKINIPKSSIESLSETLVVAPPPPPPSLAPSKQPKPKASKPKIKIPLMLNIQPQKSEDDVGLSDIPEVSGSSEDTL